VPSTGNRRITTTTWLIIGAAATTIVLWASAFVVIRAAAPVFSPGSMTLGRQIGAALLLTVFVAMRSARTKRRPQLPRWRPFLGVVLWAFLSFLVYNISLNTAGHYLDAGTMSFIVNIAPIIVALLAGLFMGEGFPGRLFLGMGVALAGVGIIAFGGDPSQISILGIGLALLCAVTYAVGTVLQKVLLRTVDPLMMTWIGCTSAVVMCLPFLPGLIAELQAAPPEAIWSLVFLGVGPTAIAFITWGYVLSRVSAGRSAASTYLVPPVVVIMAWLTIDEIPPVLSILGGALSLAGVALATIKLRRRGDESQVADMEKAPA